MKLGVDQYHAKTGEIGEEEGQALDVWLNGIRTGIGWQWTTRIELLNESGTKVKVYWAHTSYPCMECAEWEAAQEPTEPHYAPHTDVLTLSKPFPKQCIKVLEE